jgi:hypothetical protein
MRNTPIKSQAILHASPNPHPSKYAIIAIIRKIIAQ